MLFDIYLIIHCYCPIIKQNQKKVITLYKRFLVWYNQIVMRYRESEEMYLETILVLKKKLSSVRSIDIATELNYSRPSVSRAVNLLQNKGFITISKHGEIDFTEIGYNKATSIQERHSVITKVFMKLGAEESVAEENACRVEHVITDELMQVLKDFSK